MAKLQLKTFADIQNAVAEELKIQTSDTTTLNRIKRDINMIYLNEVLPETDWYWARKETKRITNSYISSGTISATKGSASLTLSAAPSVSYKGYLFASDSYAEVYKIKAHEAGSTSVTLDSPYQGTTNATMTYKVWQDGVILPVDADEVYEVYHDHHNESCNSISNLEFTELMLNSPRREGRPRWFTVEEYSDPETYASISGLPALSTRASDGNIRTLVFGSDVSSYLADGDRVMIQLAGDENYNGEVIIEDVATTTIKYVHPEVLDEDATADLNLEVLLKDQAEDDEAYRTLRVYPYLYNENTTLHIDYIQKVEPMEDDTDEPLLPLRDRIVLLYGALERAWNRIRNPEQAVYNGQKYQSKLAKMAGNTQNGRDYPKVKPAQHYLAAKRYSRRRGARGWRNF